MKRPVISRIPAFFVVTLLCWIGMPATGAFPAEAKQGLWPPSGQSIRLPVTRDTWLSSVGDEKSGSNGGAGRLKVKGQQEVVLMDIDPSPLKGKIVTGALLHLRSDSPEKAPLARIGVSTVSAEWVEGTSSGYRAQEGASSFDQAAYQHMNWAYAGSSLMDIVFGRGQNDQFHFLAGLTPYHIEARYGGL